MTASQEIAQAYLDAMATRDIVKMRSLLHDDFVLEVPYNLSGTNDPDEPDSGDFWRGKEKALANFERAMQKMVSVRFHDVSISPTPDPDLVFVEARGDIKIDDGRPYKNLYALRIELQDGKIRKVREYRNPVTAALALGRPFPAAPAT